MHLHHYQLRVVVDPYGSEAVAEAAAQDHCHISECAHAFIIVGEELELGGDEAADARDDYLAAVIVAGEDEVSAEALIEPGILRFVREHNDRLFIRKSGIGSK
jgi:hypothetical protein